MDLDLDLDSIFNGFGSGFGFKCVLGLDWILDLKKFMDLDLDLDLFLDMDSNPNPRIQIRTSLVFAHFFGPICRTLISMGCKSVTH
jgi:hypothetical protein